MLTKRILRVAASAASMLFSIGLVLSGCQPESTPPTPTLAPNDQPAPLANPLSNLPSLLGPPPTPYFLSTFDGAPSSPTPFPNADNWEIFTSGFDTRETGNTVPGGDPRGANLAHHSTACAQPEPGFPYTVANTHVMATEADAVYQCNNHIMTAPGLTGYGAIYMTPPALMNFRNGEATLTFDMSTLRTSARDWVDIVLTPFNEHQMLAYNNNDNHAPPNNIFVQVPGGGNVWLATQRVNGATDGIVFGQDQHINGDGFTTWNMVQAAQTPSRTSASARRDSFRLTLTATHLRMCIDGNDVPQTYFWQGHASFCWIDTNLPVPLAANIWGGQAAVQLNHRVYNAEKACIDAQVPLDPNPVDQFQIDHTAFGDANCPPNTWHWDNVKITPASPFRVIQAVPSNKRLTSASAQTVTFAAAAPPNTHLEFVTQGTQSALQISFNGGSTWLPAVFQPATFLGHDEVGEMVWMPVPNGTTSVMVRGQNGGWGGYLSQSFHMVSATGP